MALTRAGLRVVWCSHHHAELDGNVVVTLRVTDRSRTGDASSIRDIEGIGDHDGLELDWLARRLV